MNNGLSLWILVKSMSKAEKRWFGLQSRLQAGEKLYFSLFRLLEESSAAEGAAERFAAENPGANFDVAAKHLRRTILDCLTRLSKNDDIQPRIFDQITRAGVLFDRGLVDEAFAELRKARKLTELYEHDSLQILIRRTELRYMSATDFRDISEKRLIDKQMKINEAIKYQRIANQHNQLYDVMKYRLTVHGVARSERHAQNLNDLVLSELYLIANTSYTGFETEKLHLLFRATYSLHSGNYQTALRLYHELIELFDANPHRILNPPIHYFNALKGILDSLQSAGLYAEMPGFVDKVRGIEAGDYTQDFILGVHAFGYLMEFSYLLNTGDIDRAVALRERHEESLFHNLRLLDLQSRLQVELSAAILALVTGDLREARKWMRRIVGAGQALYRFPDYRVARLVNLLIQAESGNYDYLDNETGSLKRTIGAEKNVYQYRTEKLLFRFLKLYPLPTDNPGRERIWNRMQEQVRSLREDKYERPILKFFDFSAWIELRLRGAHGIGRS